MSERVCIECGRRFQTPNPTQNVCGLGCPALTKPKPNPDEINPTNPVSVALHDKWHVLLAAVMHKLGKSEVVLTKQDIDSFAAAQHRMNIVAQELHDGLHLKLVDMEEARRLMRENHSLPKQQN